MEKNCKNHFQVDYRSNLKLQTTKLLEKAIVSSPGKAGQVLATSYTNTQRTRQEDCYEFKASLSYITNIRPARALHKAARPCLKQAKPQGGKDFLQGDKN